ncbi:hypothetical protein CQW23_33694 [Capsicum baccatum]|uniref:F-box domain-containing protein n=1 Tax=Capsicum baccatum TaxID=33114 RepID=A0A2G2V130_CAPBA|nr:hypothetical protein CQW23_33694 [Capsicum baccatum]
MDTASSLRLALLNKICLDLGHRFVCKARNVMISNNEFRRTHCDQSKALGREKLLLHNCYTNEFELRDLETSQLVTITKGVFPLDKFRKAIILCSYDGLLLLKNPWAYKVYALWNPSTEEYQTLSCPYFNDKRKVPNGCGLCYDSSADDYKGISIGGCVFWPYYVVRNSIIVYFDGKSDELKELPMPNFVATMPKRKLLASINTPNRSRKKKLQKRKITFEDDTSIFPSEILLNILTRLPVKSLLRFKSISKPWNVMISSNEFKKSHRDQSKALGREKLLLQSRNVFEFRDLESPQLDMMENQQFPLKKFQRAEVWCLCDGLVLLRNPRADKYYVLWNPSTREYRAISCPDNHLYYNDEPR